MNILLRLSGEAKKEGIFLWRAFAWLSIIHCSELSLLVFFQTNYITLAFSFLYCS